MTFRKFEIDSYCVGDRYRSATSEIYGDKTSKGSKVLIGFCSICNGQKSMTVSDKTMQAERLGTFCKSLGRVSVEAATKLSTKVLKNPGEALEVISNIATAAATKNLKATLSNLPHVLSFYHTGERLYLGKFAKLMLYERNKNQKDYKHLHIIKNIDLEQRLGKK